MEGPTFFVLHLLEVKLYSSRDMNLELAANKNLRLNNSANWFNSFRVSKIPRCDPMEIRAELGSVSRSYTSDSKEREIYKHPLSYQFEGSIEPISV